jgi:esterase/lipase
MSTFDLMTRLCLATEQISRLRSIRFHSAIRENRPARLISEYFRMLADFLDVARQSGVVKVHGDTIVKRQIRMTKLLNFDTIRMKTPYFVILNEVEYLHELTRRLRLIAWLPGFLIHRRLFRQLLHFDREQFLADYAAYRVEGESKPVRVGAPFLLKHVGAETGVLLVHGYMATPEEVRPLAEFLYRHGLTVYACRLRGHGTSPEDLAGRSWEEWLATVERGYFILANTCRNIVLGGFSMGAGLALLTGANHLPKVRAVFAINPPMKLRKRTARLAPAVVLWNKLVERISGEEGRQYFVPNEPENPDINYRRNPLSGVKELMELMGRVSGRLDDFRIPSLVIQGSEDPVVHPEGSERLYQELGSEDKEFAVFQSKRHVIIRGEGSERIFDRILPFIQSRV